MNSGAGEGGRAGAFDGDWEQDNVNKSVINSHVGVRTVLSTKMEVLLLLALAVMRGRGRGIGSRLGGKTGFRQPQACFSAERMISVLRYWKREVLSVMGSS